MCLDVINQTWSPMFGKPMHNNCKQCVCQNRLRVEQLVLTSELQS